MSALPRTRPILARRPTGVRRMASVLRPYALHLALTLVMLIGLALVNLAIPAFVGILFNQVFEHHLWPLLWAILAGVLVVYGVRNLLYYATKRTAVHIGEHVSFELRKQLFERLQSQSLRFYQAKNPGELSSRVMDDSFVVQNFIQEELPKLLQAVCLFLALVVAIYIINWQLAVVSTVVLPLHLAAAHYFKDPIKRSSRHAQERLASVHGNLIEKFLGMEVVKGFNAEDRENAKFVEAIDSSRRSQILSKTFHVKQKIVADLLLGLGTIALLGFGSYQVMKPTDPMLPGTFIQFFAYVGMLYPAVLVLMSGFAKLGRTSACIERINEMLDAPTLEAADEAEGEEPTEPVRGRIGFKHVSFTFDQERQVLDDVSFEVPPGAVCAIMGPSGSGKTTLLSLVTRFIEPTEGRIDIDGTDARRLPLKHLRASVGIAFQECFLFNASVLENLRYARPEVTMLQIIDTAKRTGAHEFIRYLPHGYHTMLGESGVNLSRGEKQRLVLTRALLKDPRVLILDEATASIDIDSQDDIMHSVLECVRGRTVLMVTHRPELLQFADMVVRLRRGRVTYAGPPEPPGPSRPPRPERAIGSAAPALLAAATAFLLGLAGLGHADQPPAAGLPDARPIAADFDVRIGLGAAGDSGTGAGEAAGSPSRHEGPGGGFVPIEGLSEIAIEELFDTLITRARIELGYTPAEHDEEAASGLPAPPNRLTDLAVLARTDSAGARRLLQVGYRLFSTRPPHLWVYGVRIADNPAGDRAAANPDAPVVLAMADDARAETNPGSENLTMGDLAASIVTLSYIDADRAMALIKTFGYQTIEYEQGSAAVGNQTIISPSSDADLEDLPIVVAMPGTDNTSLVGGTGGGSGPFGLTMTPTGASELDDHTSGAPLLQLMVLYHPDRPEQFSRLVDRIESSIDLPARQILMEALVLEISETGLNELGVEWELTSPLGDLNLEEMRIGRLPTDLTPDRATLDMRIDNVFGHFQARLRALVRDGQAEILSRPSVLTLDNRQASIRVGEEIPVATSIAGLRNIDSLSFSFNYLPVGILLNIRPRISQDGDQVNVQIDGTVSDQVPGQDLEIRDADGTLLASAPRISTRRVQNHIRTANNTPFIIGGLVSRRDTTIEEKVPVLGDVPFLGGLFRNRSVEKRRNEVIIVITPLVLPESGVASRNLPKDEDAFDSFDNRLFRDAYRIRGEDVFDLAFITENRYLRAMRELANNQIRDNVRLADRYPYRRFADNRFSGEEFLVYRQMYEVHRRLGTYEPIQERNIIFFEPDELAEAGFSVTFLEPYLRGVSGLPRDEYESREEDERILTVIDELTRNGKALAITYTDHRGADVREALDQPVPELRIVHCPDRATWGRQLWRLNRPDERGRQRHTLLLHDRSDLIRLKRAIALKNTVSLNRSQGMSVSLNEFAVGRVLLMPDLSEETTYLLDGETAHYFFITEHYYPAFVERITTDIAALRDAIEEAGGELPDVEPRLPRMPPDIPRE